jgi:hypothetical protein
MNPNNSESNTLYALEELARICKFDAASNRINGDTPEEEHTFMEALKFGQHDNPSAAASYDQCRATMNFWDYVDSVCCAADRDASH